KLKQEEIIAVEKKLSTREGKQKILFVPDKKEVKSTLQVMDVGDLL
ncbi:hypothetical protein HYX13_04640, partial [Candidatus Woesearchaeota archaeon]|nr:hypothetical protein [Candidatus Woesearchaeota archaeon]